MFYHKYVINTFKKQKKLFKFNKKQYTFQMNDILESLRTFLEEQMPEGLDIQHISKWIRPSAINLDITLKKSKGFASIEECSTIHRWCLFWAKKQQIEKKVNISVKSESINKDLKTLQDYEENMGQKVKIELKEKIDNRRNYAGFLNSIKNDIISLKSDEMIIELQIDLIKRCRLMLI